MSKKIDLFDMLLEMAHDIQTGDGKVVSEKLLQLIQAGWKPSVGVSQRQVLITLSEPDSAHKKDPDDL